MRADHLTRIAVSVRQVAVVPELQGRVASIRGTIGYASIPLGAVTGGLIATALTPLAGDAALAITLAAGAGIGVASALPLLGGTARWLRAWRFDAPWPGGSG